MRIATYCSRGPTGRRAVLGRVRPPAGRRSRLPGWCIRLPIAGLLLLAVGGCARYRPPRGVEPETVPMTVTGYCKCGKCCGWQRNWRFQPVFNYGPQKGQRKQVGITASGTRARPGTIAADTRLYPFGTIMYIEGYGYGRVEDRGGAIKGQHIDLFFRTHQQALNWGRQQRRVKVWHPQTR